MLDGATLGWSEESMQGRSLRLCVAALVAIFLVTALVALLPVIALRLGALAGESGDRSGCECHDQQACYEFAVLHDGKPWTERGASQALGEGVAFQPIASATSILVSRYFVAVLF